MRRGAAVPELSGPNVAGLPLGEAKAINTARGGRAHVRSAAVMAADRARSLWNHMHTCSKRWGLWTPQRPSGSHISCKEGARPADAAESGRAHQCPTTCKPEPPCRPQQALRHMCLAPLRRELPADKQAPHQTNPHEPCCISVTPSHTCPTISHSCIPVAAPPLPSMLWAQGAAAPRGG